MEGRGFVREKLDIKVLILYIMARVSEPVSLQTAWELSLCDDAFGFFEFSPCLAELVASEHLSLQDGLYAITDKGRESDRAFEGSLAPSVRRKADEHLKIFNTDAHRRSLVQAEVTPGPNGLYTLHLAFRDEVCSLMSLDLTVPDKARADDLVRRFRLAPQDVYTALLGTLWGNE